VVTLFVISDMIDGLMAKITGTSSNWGAFLDSTSTGSATPAVFGGILLYFVYRESSTLWAGIALAGLVFGQWTSYVKARAESLGYTCAGGLAARADRLVIILAGALLAGLGRALRAADRRGRAGRHQHDHRGAADRPRSAGRPRRPMSGLPDRLAGLARLGGRAREITLRRLFRLGWRTAHRIPRPLVAGALAVAATSQSGARVAMSRLCGATWP
jgi:phosphatidylglycerophosphate synthase